MKHRYREVRRISADSLRELCIAKRWYTRGDCGEYENLLYDLADGKENISTDDIVEIAQDIVNHSETNQELTSVCFDLVRISVTFFEEVER